MSKENILWRMLNLPPRLKPPARRAHITCAVSARDGGERRDVCGLHGAGGTPTGFSVPGSSIGVPHGARSSAGGTDSAGLSKEPGLLRTESSDIYCAGKKHLSCGRQKSNTPAVGGKRGTVPGFFRHRRTNRRSGEESAGGEAGEIYAIFGMQLLDDTCACPFVQRTKDSKSK